MATSLNIRVLDVTYTPLAADRAEAIFNNQSPLEVPKGDHPGVYTLPVPDGATDIAIRVTKRNFYSVYQELVLKRSPGSALPSLEYQNNKQEINVRNLRVTRLGDDIHLDVFAVIGQLTDITQFMMDIADGIGVPLSLKPLVIERRGSPIINPDGVGKEVLPSTPVTVAPKGKLVFAERTTVPRLIAIYLPLGWWLAPNPYKDPEPGEDQTHYRVFFHPYINWDAGPYPYGWTYVDLIARYLVKPYEDSSGMALIYQQEAAQSQRVLVFPVGAQGSQMGTLNSQASMLRLLQEINYWAQRMEGVSYPIHIVGTCALSGFSGGIDFVNPFFRKGKNNTFYENVLTDLYVFDGVNNQASTGMTTSECCALFKNWFRQGGRQRSLRVYTQSDEWWNLMKDVRPADSGENPVMTYGPKNSNAKEANTSASTILHCPWKNLWTAMDKTLDYYQVHHIIAARFMEHAATYSVIPS